MDEGNVMGVFNQPNHPPWLVFLKYQEKGKTCFTTDKTNNFKSEFSVSIEIEVGDEEWEEYRMNLRWTFVPS